MSYIHVAVRWMGHTAVLNLIAGLQSKIKMLSSTWEPIRSWHFTELSRRKCKHYSVISVANYMFRICNWHLIRYNYTVYEFFYVSTSMKMWIVIAWVVMPYGLVRNCRRFGRTFRC